MDTLPQPPIGTPPFPDTQPTRRSRRGALVATAAVLTLVGGSVLVAITRDGADPAGSTPSPGSPTADPVAEIPEPAKDLKAKGNPFRVKLVWSAPTIGVEDARYEIRRDGTFLGYVAPPMSRFADDGVVPGSNYTYEIRVESPDGRFSEPVRVRVSTPLPLVAEARVEGTFDVKSEFVSKSGYGEYDAPGFGWKFRPSCPKGPCNISLRDITRDDLTPTLKRSGGTYTGNFTSKFEIQCEGVPVNSTGSIVLRVTKARVIDGEWRAIRLEGTLSHEEVGQLGCGSSRATLSMIARLYD